MGSGVPQAHSDTQHWYLRPEYGGAVTNNEPSGAELFAYRVNRVSVQGDVVVSPPVGGVTAVVGGNNCGKSTFLRQVSWLMTNPEPTYSFPSGFRLISEVETAHEGSPENLRSWLDMNRPVHVVDGHVTWAGRNTGLTEDSVSQWPASHHQWGQHFSLQIQHETHQGVAMRGSALEAPSHPLHVLEDHPARRAKLNDAMVRIFGQQITVDNTGSSRVLRLGVTDVLEPTLLGDKQAYTEALNKLPLLSEQGDGMQRVVSMLMTLMTSAYPVLLIDEPEAYLHPPQARAIGELIGETARELGTQVFVATHDRNILAGLLNSEADLSVVRLNRVDTTTTVHQLEVDELRDVWSDPVLRYSNILDGLFHRVVVLAEGDQDCRFYQASLDALNEAEPNCWPRTSDVLFVPSNGKQNLFKLARSLQAVAVPIVVSPDLDVINNEGTLRKLVLALGADWESLSADYQLATASFKQPRDQVSVSTVVKAVIGLLDNKLETDPKALWDKQTQQEFRELTRAAESPWTSLKEFGEIAFKGQEAVAAQRLLNSLDTRRIVTVRVGSLEQFAPDLGVSKGPEWLPVALASGAHREPVALDHVRRLMKAGTSNNIV